MTETKILENEISKQNEVSTPISIEEHKNQSASPSLEKSPIIQINPNFNPQKRTSLIKIKSKLIFSLMILLLAGVLLGGMVSPYIKESDISFLANSFLQSRQNEEFFSIFKASLFGTLALVGAIFLLGFSAISSPLLFIAPLFKGLGLGVSIGFLYLSESFNGLLKALLFIVPSGVFSSVIIVLSTNAAIRFSIYTLLCISQNQQKQQNNSNQNSSSKASPIAALIFKLFIFVVLTVLCACIDGLVSILFRGFFA